jgi:hypothetical protein
MSGMAARCAYCRAPVESCFAGHGAISDALVSGFSLEWCERCRRTVPALFGELEAAAVVPALAKRDRWSVN